MWVSRKEFEALKKTVSDGFKNQQECIQAIDKTAFNARNDVDTLTKQMKCSCENYEVEVRIGDMTWAWGGESIRGEDQRYCVDFQKHCKDCGWTTTYDTEEDALADKQALLDKQIDALKEQKKSLKKK